MNAEQAKATDAELDARASEPTVKAATLATIKFLRRNASPGMPRAQVKSLSLSWTSLVVAALIHEGYTIVEKPWTAPTPPTAPKDGPAQ